jgi:hypothetical protein
MIEPLYNEERLWSYNLDVFSIASAVLGMRDYVAGMSVEPEGIHYRYTSV